LRKVSCYFATMMRMAAWDSSLTVPSISRLALYFRGFVLHDGWHIYDSTLCVTPEIHLTTSRDVLEELAKGDGPEHFMLMLGYAGWDAGQLEDEISRNDWLVVPSSSHIVFHTPIEQRWIVGAQAMGVDKAQLSDQVGHA